MTPQEIEALAERCQVWSNRLIALWADLMLRSVDDPPPHRVIGEARELVGLLELGYDREDDAA